MTYLKFCLNLAWAKELTSILPNQHNKKWYFWWEHIEDMKHIWRKRPSILMYSCLPINFFKIRPKWLNNDKNNNFLYCESFCLFQLFVVMIMCPSVPYQQTLPDDVIKRKHFLCYWPFWGESTGHRWFPLTKAGDTEFRCFLWSAPEQTVKQTIKMPVIWDVFALIITSL